MDETELMNRLGPKPSRLEIRALVVEVLKERDEARRALAEVKVCLSDIRDTAENALQWVNHGS